MEFSKVILELVSPLHVGAGRAGMLARCYGFVPGHVLFYALVAAIGQARGGRYEHFATTLSELQTKLRCGPLFIYDAEQQRPFNPRRDRPVIEAHYLDAVNHVTLELESTSAVEGALFEVEHIAPLCLHGPKRGEPTRLIGGLWFQEAKVDNRSWSDWLNLCRLGGELKVGLGRVRITEWDLGARNYAGLGVMNGLGLHLQAGEILPGPSISGVGNAPSQPWLGRLFDPKQGFGRRFSQPVLVQIDGIVEEEGFFLPADTEAGLGCWIRYENRN